MTALQWLLWSPRRFRGVATAAVSVVLAVCLVTIAGGVLRVSSRPPSARDSRVAPLTTATATAEGSPVVAALRLIPGRSTGKAFVESGDTSEAVVRVPVAGGALDVTVEHDSVTGWTATSYTTAR